MIRLAALALPVAACAATPPVETAPVRGGERLCNPAKAQALIGRASDEDLGEDALRLSGARTVRFVPDGGKVTMDFREDRVNVHLDRAGKVMKVACG